MWCFQTRYIYKQRICINVIFSRVHVHDILYYIMFVIEYKNIARELQTWNDVGTLRLMLTNFQILKKGQINQITTIKSEALKTIDS